MVTPALFRLRTRCSGQPAFRKQFRELNESIRSLSSGADGNTTNRPAELQQLKDELGALQDEFRAAVKLLDIEIDAAAADLQNCETQVQIAEDQSKRGYTSRMN